MTATRTNIESWYAAYEAAKVEAARTATAKRIAAAELAEWVAADAVREAAR